METCPKHVESFIKNKFEKYCISLAFIIRIGVTTCLDYSTPTPKIGVTTCLDNSRPKQKKRVYSFL
jgi:hypothetical protein